MSHGNEKLLVARGLSEQVIYNRIKKIGGDGGLIAVDTNGNISMPFNTEGMYRASMNYKNEKVIEIY